jgi:hypothetical protein
MPVTLNSVFYASASDRDDKANAKPVIAFTQGELKYDTDGKKLLMVNFRPCLPALTNFEEVTFHVHPKPYPGTSGMNIRSAESATGIVGPGVGQIARGKSVPISSDLLPFYKKLKEQAREYIIGQILAKIDDRKLFVMYPYNVMNDSMKQKEWLWQQDRFWKENFTIFTPAYSEEALNQVNNDGPYAGSILAVGAEVGIAAHTDANDGGPQPIGAAAGSGVSI